MTTQQPENTEVQTPETLETSEPKTYDEKYVQELRKENAARRTALEAQREESGNIIRDLIIERETRALLADPNDLLLNNPDADIYDEDGRPDPDKIVAQAQALTRNKPHLAARAFGGDIGFGPRGKEVTQTRDFATMLRDAAR